METILDLGRQPVANELLSPQDPLSKEKFFNLKLGFNKELLLPSLVHNIPKEEIYNENYVYHSSGSETMRGHFRATANIIIDKYNPSRLLEIGSNDGVFLQHFPTSVALGIEPCGNFAKITQDMGYATYERFWDTETAKVVGEQDIIFAANCLSHIEDINEAFAAIKIALAPKGTFIMNEPHMLEVVKRCSYDQIYVEHVHIFTLHALQRICFNHGLQIMKVRALPHIHGGSMQVEILHKDLANKIIEESEDRYHGWDLQVDTDRLWKQEQELKLGRIEGYHDFAERVHTSRVQLYNLLTSLKTNGKIVASYGATAKSCTVFNYCDIDHNLIAYIIDDTPAKQGKVSPGKHIPILPRNQSEWHDPHYFFLGAWNFYDEILAKEQDFIAKGGKFITHVPSVRILP